MHWYLHLDCGESQASGGFIGIGSSFDGKDALDENMADGLKLQSRSISNRQVGTNASCINASGLFRTEVLPSWPVRTTVSPPTVKIPCHERAKMRFHCSGDKAYNESDESSHCERYQTFSSNSVSGFMGHICALRGAFSLFEVFFFWFGHGFFDVLAYILVRWRRDYYFSAAPTSLPLHLFTWRVFDLQRQKGPPKRNKVLS